MISDTPRVTIIGFGEVGGNLTADLMATGTTVTAFDVDSAAQAAARAVDTYDDIVNACCDA